MAPSGWRDAVVVASPPDARALGSRVRHRSVPQSRCAFRGREVGQEGRAGALVSYTSSAPRCSCHSAPLRRPVFRTLAAVVAKSVSRPEVVALERRDHLAHTSLGRPVSVEGPVGRPSQHLAMLLLHREAPATTRQHTLLPEAPAVLPADRPDARAASAGTSQHWRELPTSAQANIPRPLTAQRRLYFAASLHYAAELAYGPRCGKKCHSACVSFVSLWGFAGPHPLKHQPIGELGAEMLCGGGRRQLGQTGEFSSDARGAGIIREAVVAWTPPARSRRMPGSSHGTGWSWPSPVAWGWCGKTHFGC